MFKGKTTSELYEKILKDGFCSEHLKDLEISYSESHEVQKRAFLYLRLQIISPLVFHKPFTFDKMQKLFTMSTQFGGSNHPEEDPEFEQNVLFLDSIAVFTICHFSKICCLGALFLRNQQGCSIPSKESTLLNLLTKKYLQESDICILVSTFEDNFSGEDEQFYKLCYVATLLLVRNVSLGTKLKTAIELLDKELITIPKECKPWLDTGNTAFKRGHYTEAINAYTSGLKYNSYCVPLLLRRAEAYTYTNQYSASLLDSYIVLMIKPTNLLAVYHHTVGLFHLHLYNQCINVIEYGLEKAENGREKKYLKSLKTGAKNHMESNFTCCCQQSRNSENRSQAKAEGKKNIPSLIEASDSENEAQDIPELLEGSNSDDSGSDSEATKVTAAIVKNFAATSQSSEKEKVVNSHSSSSKVKIQKSSYDVKIEETCHKTKKTASENTEEIPKSSEVKVEETCHKREKTCSENAKEEEDKIQQMKCTLREASQKLVDGCGPSALRTYREALDEIKAFPKVYNYEEFDIVCVKYALGISYCKSGGYDDLQKAVATFKGIADDHSSVSFPATYYGIALAYYKFNRFKEALHYLHIVDDIMTKGIHMKVYFWPESTSVIEETKTENLKIRVKDLLNECENPPAPEAICRLPDCSLHSLIYYTDPDFKGFFTIQCSDQCSLQFHPLCWKVLKTEKHFSDKEFLDQNCITPDCEGFIVKIETIDKEGNLGKVFLSADSKKTTKKKTKSEKKLEVKEEKRRKRRDSSSKNDVISESTSENSNDIQPPPETKPEPESSKSDMEADIKDTVEEPSIPINSELFTVLKKEKIVDENITKATSKIKENKKSRNTLSIDEFLECADTHGSTNEYQQRLNVLKQNKQEVVEGPSTNHNLSQLRPSAATFEPPKVPNFAHASSAYGLDDFPQILTPAPVPTNDTHLNEAIESNHQTFSPSSTHLSTEFSVECAKKNTYCYIKDILCKHGPLREDDPILIQELQAFPLETNELIADCGGLGKFLQKSVEFAFVGDTYVCTIDQLPRAYKIISSAHVSLNSPGYCDNINEIDDSYPYDSQQNPTDPVHFPWNPEAKEYNPPKLVGRNSPHLVSAISKLRQPLTVDEVHTKERSGVAGSFSMEEVLSADEYVPSISSSDSYLPGPNGDTAKSLTKLQLARKCAEAVKIYFGTEAEEYRSYIRQFLQPYAIVEISKKNSLCIQTESIESEKISKGTMKTDEELLRLKEVVNCLTEENVSLKEQAELLGEQCSSALDNVTKTNKQTGVKMLNLKKGLEEANIALEVLAKDSKSRESKLEKEIKLLTESLKKNKEEISTKKTEMNEVLAANENLKLSLTQAQDQINMLRKDNCILKTTYEIQCNKFEGDIKNLVADKVKILKRAEAAELKLRYIQKTEYLRRIDGKTAEAIHKMKELKTGMSVANLNPVFIDHFGALLTQIQNYIAKLGKIRIDFSTNIDAQINSIKNGISLEELDLLEMNELPEIPSWSTQLPMQNGAPPNAQTPSWISRVQLLNANSFPCPPNSSMQTNFRPMLSNQQALLQNIHPSNPNTINQGAIPKSNGKPNVPVASNMQNPAPLRKLPPGLQDPLQPISSRNASEIGQSYMAARGTNALSQPSRVGAQSAASVAQPQSVAVPPKESVTPRGRSASSSSGSESIGASMTSLGSLASKSSLDVSKACDNYDALELDYNVKKNSPKITTVPVKATASSSKPTTAKNSYEKLIQRLRNKYPEATQAQLASYVKDFRSQKSSLSGFSIDMIINQIVAMVEAKKQAENKGSEPVQKGRLMPSKALVNKKLVSNDSAPSEHNTNTKKPAWGVSGESSKTWHGKDIEDACTICFEEMTLKTAYKVDCGHTFHLTCIKEWMNKKSDCPICRVHLLLPEDYPAL